MSPVLWTLYRSEQQVIRLRRRWKIGRKRDCRKHCRLVALSRSGPLRSGQRKKGSHTAAWKDTFSVARRRFVERRSRDRSLTRDCVKTVKKATVSINLLFISSFHFFRRFSSPQCLNVCSGNVVGFWTCLSKQWDSFWKNRNRYFEHCIRSFFTARYLQRNICCQMLSSKYLKDRFLSRSHFDNVGRSSNKFLR